MTEPIWISEQDVVEMIDLSEAIVALEHGLVLQAKGDATNMVKTHVGWGGNNLHAIGAAYPGEGIIGTKTWAHTSGGACPLLILFDAQTGQLKAIIEAFALGQMRTGGISGLATKFLAPEKAETFALIGTGKQALAQTAAVLAVRPIKQIRVFSPKAESRKAFIEKATDQIDVELINAGSVSEAVAGASVVTTVTRATEAFLHAKDLEANVHINAVGAITNEREELSQDILDSCSRVVVDDLSATQRLSSEFRQAFGEKDAWHNVFTLSSVIAQKPEKQGESGITVFKAMGMGVSDLALGIELYKRSVDGNVGRKMPQPTRVSPRLLAASGQSG